MLILAGDIGGTNSRLAIFDAQLNKQVERDFENKNRSSLSQCVAEFLSDAKCKPDRACFGVAGPVSRGRVEMTNLGWTIEESVIASEFGIAKVRLINDMIAHAEGIEVLKPDQVVTIKPGEDLEGNRCIIAAGTGLGEGGLAWDRDHWVPFASEGGHTDFAPTDPEQDELLKWARKRFNGPVCWEHLASGPGVKVLYDFLTQTRTDLKDRLPVGQDSSKQITQSMDKSDLARATVELFTKLYLAEAGNLTLKTISLAGCYIGGGIAISIQSLLKRGDFQTHFWNKGNGQMRETLKRIPIKLITSDKNGLHGAANAGRKL